MGITAMALALMLLTLVAGRLQWSLLVRFDEFYPVGDDGISHARRVRVLFCALTGLAAVGVLAMLVLELQRLVTS